MQIVILSGSVPEAMPEKCVKTCRLTTVDVNPVVAPYACMSNELNHSRLCRVVGNLTRTDNYHKFTPVHTRVAAAGVKELYSCNEF